MNFEQLIASIDADTYQRLKTAVELGKWPNGQSLTREQKELSLQAVIAFETRNLPPEQRTGYIERNKPTACGHSDDEVEEEVPLRWE
ncbi:YeaC family protein [Proteobacteria bacterium 005FR1]|nr:YeaC family protein [Proteobacteria bacterium 005FR1]